MKRPFIYWLILAIAVTGLSMMSYVLVQQTIRLEANETQIQMAEDTAASIENGANPLSTMPLMKVDLATSIAPYLVIYDMKGQVIASNGILLHNTLSLPTGVFVYTKANQEDRFTWQPQPGIREAVVIRYFHTATLSGYVLAGKSLRETETLEDLVAHDMLLLWIGTLMATLLATIILSPFISKQS